MWLPFISKIKELEKERNEFQKSVGELLLFVRSIMKDQGEFIIPDTIGSGNNTYNINGRMFSFNGFDDKHCGFFINGKKVSLKKFIDEAQNKRGNNMEIFDKIYMLSAICKISRKFGMYINFDKDQNGPDEDQDWREIIKAAPYLDFSINHQIFLDGQAWLLFDSEEEMLICYNQTVGDDGPTKLNQYKGKATVYALTCSPIGELLNENT